MDQYKVVGRIGEGAHGLVLRGQHRVTGKEVALKKVLLKKLEDGIPIFCDQGDKGITRS